MQPVPKPGCSEPESSATAAAVSPLPCPSCAATATHGYGADLTATEEAQLARLSHLEQQCKAPPCVATTSNEYPSSQAVAESLRHPPTCSYIFDRTSTEGLEK